MSKQWFIEFWGHKLVALLVLSAFVVLFTLVGFFLGWHLRRAEDVYVAEHQHAIAVDAATTAALMAEEKMLCDLHLRPCADAPAQGGKP
jgi:hypothetical protein